MAGRRITAAPYANKLLIDMRRAIDFEAACRCSRDYDCVDDADTRENACLAESHERSSGALMTALISGQAISMLTLMSARGEPGRVEGARGYRRLRLHWPKSMREFSWRPPGYRPRPAAGR